MPARPRRRRRASTGSSRAGSWPTCATSRPGSPTEVAGNAPFVSGRWLFAHNGFVDGFRDGRARRAVRRSSRRPGRRRCAGDADSEVLFGLILDRLDAGEDARRRPGRRARAARGHGGTLQRRAHRRPAAAGHLPRQLALPASLPGTQRHRDRLRALRRRARSCRWADAIAGEWQQLADGTLVELDDENGSETSELFEGARR